MVASADGMRPFGQSSLAHPLLFTEVRCTQGMNRRGLTTALGAGGVAIVAVLLAARAGLAHQAALARRRIGKPLGEDAIAADRVWRAALGGPPLELLMVGDSIAAGLGAKHRKETLGARVAKETARRLERSVRLRTAAVVGSESSDLAGQLDALPSDYRADVAVIIVGGNDVTHRVPIAESVAHLEAAVRRLRERGAGVVVGTCPDLRALRAVPQPLRSLAARMSWQLANAQHDAAVREGAVPVSLRRAVGSLFIERPDEMFSVDRFHPSALGYRRTAEALAPAVASLGAPAPARTTPR
jgi:lysophospholipase L1-like esterase